MLHNGHVCECMHAWRCMLTANLCLSVVCFPQKRNHHKVFEERFGGKFLDQMICHGCEHTSVLFQARTVHHCFTFPAHLSSLLSSLFPLSSSLFLHSFSLVLKYFSLVLTYAMRMTNDSYCSHCNALSSICIMLTYQM